MLPEIPADSIQAISGSFISEETRWKEVRYYLLELDRGKATIKITGFSQADLDQATRMYVEMEKKPSDKGNETVLVSVDKLRDLRKAYPNYYADTREFLDILRMALK